MIRGPTVLGGVPRRVLREWVLAVNARRSIHADNSTTTATLKSTVIPASTTSNPIPGKKITTKTNGSNPALSFPCVDQNELRTAKLLNSLKRSSSPTTPIDHLPNSTASTDPEGPEPAYTNTVTGYSTFTYSSEFPLDYGGHLPSFDLAYETWGQMNADKSNAILLHTGLSASSHAKSNPGNPAEGWWEKFIGPGKALDTRKYFVICTNVLGGCYGSTGPASLDPSDSKPYATRFPMLSIFDMVRAQFLLLDDLGVDKLYASVGSSMGGMQSIAAGYLEPERVGRVVSISGTARSSPSSIAMRHAQRSVLMADPNWNRGFYYDRMPPHTGMKLARQIATITYRSGPEWEQRFGRRRRDLTPPAAPSPSHLPSAPVLCPDFLIETYLDHQGEQFCLKYDANSLIYISKAMDLFDMSQENLDELKVRRERVAAAEEVELVCKLGESEEVSNSTLSSTSSSTTNPTPIVRPPKLSKSTFISSLPSSHSYLPSLSLGLTPLKNHPTLIIGVQSDTLFPIEQQRELSESLKSLGNKNVVYYELNSPWGHDTFLLEEAAIGGAIRGFLQ